MNATPLLLFTFALSGTTAAHADPKTEERLLFCKTCHRPGYTVSYVPTLDGQPREYLFNQLKAYKERRRPSDGHQRYWAELTEDDMRAVADHFASNAPVREVFDVDARKVAVGESKANTLQCAACHLATYAGKESAPRLAGLQPQYAGGQIRAFIAGARQHPRIDGTSQLSADDAEALGHYFAQVR
jgi:cytochrome c553